MGWSLKLSQIQYQRQKIQDKDWWRAQTCHSTMRLGSTGNI